MKNATEKEVKLLKDFLINNNLELGVDIITTYPKGVANTIGIINLYNNMPTKYEIVNKATGEVLAVDSTTFNESTVEVTAGGLTVTFDNALKDGNLLNAEYTIREVGTHNQPNGEAEGSNVIDEVAVNE